MGKFSWSFLAVVQDMWSGHGRHLHVERVWHTYWYYWQVKYISSESSRSLREVYREFRSCYLWNPCWCLLGKWFPRTPRARQNRRSSLRRNWSLASEGSKWSPRSQKTLQRKFVQNNCVINEKGNYRIDQRGYSWVHRVGCILHWWSLLEKCVYNEHGGPNEAENWQRCAGFKQCDFRQWLLITNLR